MTASDTAAATSTGEPIGEPITHEGLATLKAEVAELEGPGRRAMGERIKAARELGDLKENADYHIAKEDQAVLETKIKRLNERLRRAVEVEVDADTSGDTFAFGRTAEVLDEGSGKTHSWKLVGASEADPREGRMSVESPVGQALLNAPIGEQVKLNTPGGPKAFRVEKLVG